MAITWTAFATFDPKNLLAICILSRYPADFYLIQYPSRKIEFYPFIPKKSAGSQFKGTARVCVLIMLFV